MRGRRRRRLVAASALLGSALALQAPPAAGQDRALYEEGRRHWTQARYDRAYPLLREYRRGYQGRTALVDYMIGTSACRIPERKSFGFRILDWLLYAYPLSEEGRAQVTAERDLCMEAVLEAADPTQVAQVTPAGVTGRGKTFHFLDNDLVAAYPIRRIRDLPIEELAARRTEPTDAGARANAARRAGEHLETPHVVTAGSYVIASRAERRPEHLEALARRLERFTDFQVRSLGVKRPPFLITIYLTDTVSQLRRLARELHGLDVSPSTIGYSFAGDLSVAAVTPADRYGTVLHELTHLLIRGNFGDAPQWVDEGVASLYEVSTESNGAWRGRPNWRGRVLKENRGRWPSLAEVLASPWFAFDDPQSLAVAETPSGTEQAILTAYNRYFMLFLQERGELAEVFAAVRDRGLAEAETDWNDADDERAGTAQRHLLRLVEKTLGPPIPEVDAALREWIDSLL